MRNTTERIYKNGATYEELLVEALPARIETDADYDRLHAASASYSGKAA